MKEKKQNSTFASHVPRHPILKDQNLLPLFIEEKRHDELQRLEFPEQATK
jgi:hypothetical protein